MNITSPDFYYQDVASPIVDAIIDLVSRGIKQFESYEQWLYDIPITDNPEQLHFNWRYNVCRIKDENWTTQSGYDLYGLAGRDYCDEPSIDISIAIPQRKHQKKISINRAELFDVVAHEIHHLAQNMDSNGYTQPRNKRTGHLSYFLDPYEIEAFHIGTRARVALTGRSFEDIAYEYISNSWPAGSQKEIFEVINAWKNTDFPAFTNNLKGVIHD